MQGKILNTARLNLREFEKGDAPFIIHLLNAPNWLKYIGERNISNLQQAETYITSLTKSYRENGFGLWKMERQADQQALGMCGLVKRNYLEFPDIGFAILPEHQGQGYTVEASRGVLDYCRTQLHLHTLAGITSDDNVTSQAVLRKIGLKYVKTIVPAGEKNELLYFEVQLSK